MKEYRWPLIQARRDHGLTMAQLGKLAGVSPTIICRLENSWDRDTSGGIKAAICEALDLDKFPERERSHEKAQEAT